MKINTRNQNFYLVFALGFWSSVLIWNEVLPNVKLKFMLKISLQKLQKRDDYYGSFSDFCEFLLFVHVHFFGRIL